MQKSKLFIVFYDFENFILGNFYFKPDFPHLFHRIMFCQFLFQNSVIISLKNLTKRIENSSPEKTNTKNAYIARIEILGALQKARSNNN